MADSMKIVWPSASWATLKKIIRAWYAVSGGDKDVKQKEVASVAGMQAPRLSMNKPFLQAMWIIDSGGSKLTPEGQQLGLGLTQDNKLLTSEALAALVRSHSLLRQLWDTIRARGIVDKDAFVASVIQITKQGKEADYFGTGVNVLADILLESGLIQETEKGYRATNRDERIEKEIASVALQKAHSGVKTELQRIPIPVSAGTIWYVEVAENPDEFELEKFLDMQKLVFSRKQ